MCFFVFKSLLTALFYEIWKGRCHYHQDKKTKAWKTEVACLIYNSIFLSFDKNHLFLLWKNSNKIYNVDVSDG